MNNLIQKLVITLLATNILYLASATAQVSPSTPKAAHVVITEGPEIESARPLLVIITWTTNNPGGSPEHYGVVHYGTSPKDLSQTAKNPIRLNPGHTYTVFRVRMDDLPPRTKFYYKVESMEANGTSDGVTSPIKDFTTP